MNSISKNVNIFLFCISGVSENQKYREKILINACAVPLICNPLKNQVFDTEGHCFEYLKGFKFGDCLDRVDEIVVLIGSDFYWEVFTGKAREENGPDGLETKVDWVLSGVVGERKNETHTNFISHIHVLKIANERS